MSSSEYYKQAEQYDLYNLIGCPVNVNYIFQISYIRQIKIKYEIIKKG